MDINSLTIGQAKEIASFFTAAHKDEGLNGMIGEKVIVRTLSAGVWFGILAQKSGNEVILKNGRRMWLWKAVQSISLSACANYGVVHQESKIVGPVPLVWLEAIEIIPCSESAVQSLEAAPPCLG